MSRDPGKELRDSPVLPTPETLAKLEPDPLWTLVRKGTLSTELVGHAFAIRRAYEIITSPVRVRTMRAVSSTDGSSFDMVGGRAHSGTRESEHSITLQERYNAWTDAMGREHMPTGPVLDVIVEGFSCRMIERKCHKRNGWMSKFLVDSLTLYAECRRREHEQLARTNKFAGERRFVKTSSSNAPTADSAQAPSSKIATLRKGQQT